MSETPVPLAATDRATYPLWGEDKIRWGDEDRQGHANNAVYTTYFESGRVKYIRDDTLRLLEPGETFIVVRIEIDFRAELRFPSTIDIGLRTLAVGRSSFRFGQGIFDGPVCAATAEVVMIVMDQKLRKAKPLSPHIVGWLDSIRTPA